MVRTSLLILLLLTAGCYPHLTWDNPCDPRSDNHSQEACSRWIALHPDVDFDGDGYSTTSGDCDETNPRVNPGVAEEKNSIDDNCNGIIDEGTPVWSQTLAQSELFTARDLDNDGNDELVAVTENGYARVLSAGGLEPPLLEKSLGTTFSLPPVVISDDKTGNIYITALGETGSLFVMDENLNVEWSATITGNKFFAPQAVTSPAGTFLFIGANTYPFDINSGYGWIYMFAPALGKSSLRYFSTGSVISAPPAVWYSEGITHVLVPVAGGRVRLLDGSGTVEGEFITGSQEPVTARPLVLQHENSLYAAFGSSNWTFYLGDLSTFSFLWTYASSAPVYTAAVSGDVDADGVAELFFASEDGFVRALDFSGTLLWEHQLDGSIFTSPLFLKLYNRFVLVCLNTEGHLYVLDAASGSVLWESDTLVTNGDVIPLKWNNANYFFISGESKATLVHQGSGLNIQD